MKSDNTHNNSVIYRCNCGHQLYLEVENFEPELDWGQRELSISLIEEPKNWWFWFKMLLKGSVCCHDIILNMGQAKELGEYLIEATKDNQSS